MSSSPFILPVVLLVELLLHCVSSPFTSKIAMNTPIKMSALTSCLVLMACLTPTSCSSISDLEYMKMRSDLISQEEHMRIGGNLVLSPKECIVNDVFMKEKRQMIENSLLNKTVFKVADSIYLSKAFIEETNVFKIIQRMPKGAALHNHDQSMVSAQWIVKNVTYRNNVFMCARNGSLIFKVLNHSSADVACLWKSVMEERKASGNPDKFDDYLLQNLSMLATDPLVTYVDSQAAWVRFIRFFTQVRGLLYHVPIFRDMVYRTLEEFREANVQYLEIRGDFTGFFDLNGTVHDTEFGVLLVKQAVDRFTRQYPDFSGAKVIISGLRNRPVPVILEQIKTTMALQDKYPDLVIGYDLAGNEAAFKPFTFYIDALLYPSRQVPPYKLPYFLHAGETNWQGTAADDNLADAILLNSTRIGHGFALSKHPRLAQLVKSKDIAVEVQPISNQVLRLVSDFRNHPMAGLMAADFPIVIGTDDRTTLGTSPQSHDFYIAFMTMSSEKADLTFLKQLALNSLRYSQMNAVEKDNALKIWNYQWDKFITETVALF
ncbi:unnamed protein product [Lymnaea stagnalis]|uniref:adenosine deaminase n=1 Tax=Lymnaea stagnalis TaxID=6523 RepID=A0AAV2H767_LYMST